MPLVDALLITILNIAMGNVTLTFIWQGGMLRWFRFDSQMNIMFREKCQKIVAM